jgi:glutaminyl-peptide cyclotransferase
LLNSLKLGTGLETKSQLRKVKIDNGQVIQFYDLNPLHFGEGICMLGDYIYQLTWQNRKIYRYSKKEEFVDKAEVFEFPVNTFREGWGITTDGKSLIVSDGTSNIYFMTQQKSGPFLIHKVISVTYENTPIRLLNELEYIEDTIWANVWGSYFIYIINPKNGHVERRINCSGLKTSGDVLNGIAYDANSKRIYVTGKEWPHVYQIHEVRE